MKQNDEKKNKKKPLFYTTNTFHYNPSVNVLDSVTLNHRLNIKPITFQLIQLSNRIIDKLLYQERQKEFIIL